MKKTLLITALLISTFGAFAQKNTSTSYIEKFKDNAVALMHKTGIPASIILGIAMHESGCGNSAVAQNLNNQFGVVGAGHVTYLKNKKKVRSQYKKYDSIFDSFQDFARIMTERKQFSHLTEELNPYDYEKWVKGIAHGGYAGSRTWSIKVLAIIRKYHLNDLDGKPEEEAQLAENIK